VTQLLQRGELHENLSREKEVFGLVNEIRRAVNLTYEANADVTTAGTGVATVAWTSPTMPTDGAWTIEVRTIGFSILNGNGGMSFTVLAAVRSDSGTLTIIQGASTTVASRTDAGGAVDIATSGQTVQVRVTDNGVWTVKWKVHISLLEVVK